MERKINVISPIIIGENKYNTLTDEGKDQALSYVRSLSQKEQCKNVVSI